MCDNELRKVLLLALSATFLFVYEISPEPLNGFAPNSQARRVWSLAGMSLKVKVKGQGHHGQKRVFRRIYREPMNGYATNSHGRHVWSLARTSLKVKVSFGDLRAVCLEKTPLR